MISFRYSVIIPHYNSPFLLERCLETIPLREDIQIIIIDDCSDSNIVDINHLPGNNRSHTEIHSTPIGGSAGRARNIGLAHAKGEWLIFADADDFFLPNAWNIFDKYTNTNNDVIYFQYTSVNSDTLQPDCRQQVYGRYFDAFFANPNEYTLDHLRFRHDVPWGKMIRKSLVDDHHISFGETRYCNDTLFSTQIALAATSVVVEIRPVYCVTSSDNSLTRQISKEALLTRLDVILTKNQILRDNHKTIHQLSVLFYFRYALHYGFPTLLKAILLVYHHKTTLLMIYVYSRLYRN